MEREGGGEGSTVVCTDNDFSSHDQDNQLISLMIQGLHTNPFCCRRAYVSGCNSCHQNTGNYSRLRCLYLVEAPNQISWHPSRGLEAKPFRALDPDDYRIAGNQSIGSKMLSKVPTQVCSVPRNAGKDQDSK